MLQESRFSAFCVFFISTEQNKLNKTSTQTFVVIDKENTRAKFQKKKINLALVEFPRSFRFSKNQKTCFLLNSKI